MSPFGRRRSPFGSILATKPVLAFDFVNAAMFQDTAGLIPAGIGDPVALVRAAVGPDIIQGVNDDYRPTRTAAGLHFDGIDDWMQSVGSVNLSHTDEITAMIALTKDSDAVIGYPLELSTSYFGNDGSFQFSAPPDAAQDKFGFAVHGTNPVSISQTGHAAPNTAVLTGITKISDDALRFQVDGVEVSNAANLGGGNFGNWPLFIGGRNGTSRFFSGTIAAVAFHDVVPPDVIIAQNNTAMARMQGRSI